MWFRIRTAESLTPTIQNTTETTPKQFACHQPLSDKPFGEKYSDMAYPFILMDPGTRYWQATIAAAVGGVQKAGNTSGVYLDQTASYYAEPCYGKEPLRTGGGAR